MTNGINEKAGFTLAEVLITLGIIGVVAAMTIPTLIANTNGAKFRSQFKKTISTLNQAALMSVAQYDYDFAGTTGVCGATPSLDLPTSNVPGFCGLLNGTLTGYSVTYVGSLNNYSPTLYNVSGDSRYIAYQLADGAIVAFSNAASNCTVPIGGDITDSSVLPTRCHGFIDVNGVTMPNKEVTCETASNTAVSTGTCTVPNDATHMTDIFPVAFHDATVEPLTNAARYVLTTSK